MKDHCVIEMKTWPDTSFERAIGPLSSDEAIALCKNLTEEEDQYRPHVFFYQVARLQLP